MCGGGAGVREREKAQKERERGKRALIIIQLQQKGNADFILTELKIENKISFFIYKTGDVQI